MRAIKLAAVFLSCLGFSALVAWVGGFDFDQRGFWVGWGLVLAVSFSGSVTVMASALIEEKTHG